MNEKDKNIILKKLRNRYNSKSLEGRIDHSLSYTLAQLTTIDQLIYKTNESYRKLINQLNQWKNNILEDAEKDLLNDE